MKELIIKDWLYQKIARENGCPLVWEGHIDAVFAETEKAYKVMMEAVAYTVCTWIPKSQCEWREVDGENDETKVVDSYEEALEIRDYLRSCYC